MKLKKWHKSKRFEPNSQKENGQFEPKSLAQLLRNHWHNSNRISQIKSRFELLLKNISNRENANPYFALLKDRV